MHYKKIKTDIKRRLAKPKNFEIKRFLNGYLLTNIHLSRNNRECILKELWKTKPTQLKAFRKTIKNICLESGQQKSIVSLFRVNRHVFKKNASKKLYPGVRKASW